MIPVFIRFFEVCPFWGSLQDLPGFSTTVSLLWYIVL